MLSKSNPVKREDLPRLAVTMLPDGERCFLFKGFGIPEGAVSFEKAANGDRHLVIRIVSDVVELIEWSVLSEIVKQEEINRVAKI